MNPNDPLANVLYIDLGAKRFWSERREDLFHGQLLHAAEMPERTLAREAGAARKSEPDNPRARRLRWRVRGARRTEERDLGPIERGGNMHQARIVGDDDRDRELVLLALVLGLAALLRLVMLGRFPPGLYFDEAADAAVSYVAEMFCIRPFP